MIRVVLVVLTLAGCASQQPSFKTYCPAAPTPPAPAPKKPTPMQAYDLEIRVELWAEELLSWGNACADAVKERDQWIRRK